MNKFILEKQKQLNKGDKSNIGEWDPRIKDLCNNLNSSDNYYTTSSCAGRIVLLKSKVGKIEKKRDAFLFRSHEKISFKELKKVLSEIDYKGLVDFKQSSSILHVVCKTMDDAQKIVNDAKFCGWKHSGIMTAKKRIVVELNSTERIDFPVMNKGRILVDDNFLKLIVKESNSRLERTWNKIDFLNKKI